MEDYTNWMGRMNPIIGEIKLKDLILPGSHDSGTKEISCPFGFNGMGRCQSKSISEQLRIGIRFFDFYVKSVLFFPPFTATIPYEDFMIYHGACSTPLTIESVMNEINDFLSLPESSQEIVMIHFTKLGFSKNKTQDDLLNILTTYNGDLNQKCVSRPRPASIASATHMTVNQLLDNGKQLILLFDYESGDPATIEANYPVWCNKSDDAINGILIGPWESFQNVDDLVKEMGKWQEKCKSSEALFILQGILTVNGIPPARSVEEFSKDSNQYILDWIANEGIKNRLNLLYLNFVGESYSKTWTENSYVQMTMDLNKEIHKNKINIGVS
ncbi:MAG: hypothetical protein JKY02_06395 [Flavobacteriaceae bacterium]|nr:hypothetical protein [Flavobacteriaceae bacterium]